MVTGQKTQSWNARRLMVWLVPMIAGNWFKIRGIRFSMVDLAQKGRFLLDFQLVSLTRSFSIKIGY